MYRKFLEVEKLWIEKILSKEFKGKQFLLKQMSTAKILCEEGYDFISLKF